MLTHLAPVPDEAFLPILKELERRPIPMNPYRKQAGSGRSAAFGFVNKRCLPPDLSRLCWQRPYLYKLLLDYGQRYVPLQGWNSVTLNQDYAAAPHRDKGNKGLSYLVAFGDYQEGELEIHSSRTAGALSAAASGSDDEPDCSGTFGIRHQPILFDGAKLLHSVRPFTGHRYSLVFYTLERDCPKPLTAYTPLQTPEGTWVLEYTDTEGTKTILTKTQGLPHPLRGRSGGPSGNPVSVAYPSPTS